jgi:hypothetical protein
LTQSTTVRTVMSCGGKDSLKEKLILKNEM